MTARPFSRLEPVSKPDDPARAIATFFTVVAGIGAIPAAYWTVVLLFMTFSAFAAGKFPGGLALLGVLAYAALGFAQLRFYIRRTAGRARRYGRRWWISTYLFNLVPLGVSISALIQSPHIGAAIAALWFAGLCTLAIVAYGAEARIHPRLRGDR